MVAEARDGSARLLAGLDDGGALLDGDGHAVHREGDLGQSRAGGVEGPTEEGQRQSTERDEWRHGLNQVRVPLCLGCYYRLQPLDSSLDSVRVRDRC